MEKRYLHIHERLKMNEIYAEKSRGYIYYITHISVAHCSRAPNMISKLYYDIALLPYGQRNLICARGVPEIRGKVVKLYF